jgi:glycosyltransferase involved in cell wall biosynthesis
MICLANEYFPPHAPGGAEWSTEALARGLAARGERVVVVTPNYGAPPDETRDGFRIRRFAFPLKRPIDSPAVSSTLFGSPLFYLYAALQLARLAHAASATVIHAQNKHMLVPAWIAGRLLRAPVVLTIRDGSLIDAAPMCLLHGDRRPPDCGVRKLWRECAQEYLERYSHRRPALWVKSSFLYRWRQACFKQRFLRRLDAVVGVSEGILDIYRRSGLLEGVRRVVAIPTIPPLDPPAGDPASIRRRYNLPEGPLVLYVGKSSYGKGTADLVKAAEMVVKRSPGVAFAFVGSGHDVAAPWAHRLGRMPNAEVLALYEAADVTVVPSRVPEALNRVILEAMAAGRAVIGTRVGGTPELIGDGVTGLLVERGDVPGLATALERLLGDPTLRARLGEAARRHVREGPFAPAASLDRLLALYAELERR